MRIRVRWLISTRWLGLLAGFVVVSNHAFADDEASRRAFVESLTRRASIPATRDVVKPAIDHRSTSTGVRDASRVQETAHHGGANSPALARVPTATGSPGGVAALSPLVATGFGLGRDLYISALFPGILGRSPTESELYFWSRKLRRGASTQQVANEIWQSKEHRLLIKEHRAPNIPLKRVEIYAVGYANDNK